MQRYSSRVDQMSDEKAGVLFSLDHNGTWVLAEEAFDEIEKLRTERDDLKDKLAECRDKYRNGGLTGNVQLLEAAVAELAAAAVAKEKDARREAT